MEREKNLGSTIYGHVENKGGVTAGNVSGENHTIIG